MINYEVDPAVLAPHLPPYTELDSYNGKTLVSVVGFMFNNTRVFKLRWPLHTNFPEVNLRFYVRHFTGKEWKRGVVFISEIVPSPIIAFAANNLYHEHYTAMPMRNMISASQERIDLSYEWKLNGRWNQIKVNAPNFFQDIIPNSEEEFIFEHYWGYNQYNITTTVEYGVEHISWQVAHVQSWSLNCDIEKLYGSAFVPFLSQKPHSVFLAKGSDVLIRKPIFIKKS